MSDYVYPITAREQSLLDRLAKLAPGFAAAAPQHDERAEIPREALETLHREGFDEAVLPADLGGDGISSLAYGEIVRGLAAADPSLATIWVMHVGAGVGLAQLTRGTLGDFYATAFLRGDRFSNALSEPTSGNRFLNPQQEAAPVDGGWSLTGAKRFVSGSEIADHLLVNVAIDGQPVFFGVEPDESIEIIPIWDTLGLRATRSQLLHFNDTLLREDRRGGAPALTDFNGVGAGLPNISLGVATAALDAIRAHTSSRVIAGAPLAHQQWLQHEVADVSTRLDAAIAYTRHALWQADRHDPRYFGSLDRAKYLANKVAVDIAQLGVRAGGASGFLKSSPIQRHLRDAQAGQLMAYSTEVLASLIGADVLGAAHAPTTESEQS